MPRSFEREFGIGPDGWTTGMQAVQRLLDHLARRMKSWSTRDRYLEILQGFVRFAGESPDRLVSLTSEGAGTIKHAHLEARAPVDREG